MRTPLAWFNTTQNMKRTAAAVGGICFAILLIFMQWGFLSAARLNASMTYRLLDFDAIIIARGYLNMPRSETIPRHRLNQARGVSGVASAYAFSVDGGRWHDLSTGKTTSCFILGVPPTAPIFLDASLNARLPTLREPLTMLVDRLSRPNYGPWKVGGLGKVNGAPLNIVGDFSLGMGLLADGCVIVSEDNYMRLFGMQELGRPNFGLIKFSNGANPEEVMASLRKALPADVVVLTRDEIIRREERYFVSVKPVGIMFQVGMLVAFAVGAVILYQILASEISNRLREFATLKAMGYTENYIYRVGIQQGLLFSLLGYLPSLLLALGLYRLLRTLSGFPVYMDWIRVFGVLGLSLVMCGIAAALSLGKIKRADPADLF